MLVLLLSIVRSWSCSFWIYWWEIRLLNVCISIIWLNRSRCHVRHLDNIVVCTSFFLWWFLKTKEIFCTPYILHFICFSGVRPFGVSLLIAGYDDNGPQLYQVCMRRYIVHDRTPYVSCYIISPFFLIKCWVPFLFICLGWSLRFILLLESICHGKKCVQRQDISGKEVHWRIIQPSTGVALHTIVTQWITIAHILIFWW
jgi:hypothetical protein